MQENRYLRPWILEDLKTKMVFVGGPRQVGKTTLALSLLENGSKTHPDYFNWDVTARRKAILKDTFPPPSGRIVLDEIHKYARWRNLLKGLYDSLGPEKQFIVTGSARLDHYRKGGDSLLGRYHYFRLHPFSLRELNNTPGRDDVKHLLSVGGFPEPCLSGSERTWRRWNLERVSRVIREDLRDLERVRELSLIEILLDAIPDRVGSLLSIQSLAEDLEISHDSVRRWIDILDNLYLTFRISPHGLPKLRSIKKAQKIYLWDWRQVEDEGGRLENMVASHLLKYCHFIQDTQGHKMELKFLRDTQDRELDFVVFQDKRPLFAVECKVGERERSKHALYFRERAKIPSVYQVHLGTKDYGSAEKDVRVLPFHTFCKELELP